MKKKHSIHVRQLNVRMPPDLYGALTKVNISEFVRLAIQEKLERDRDFRHCPTCRGVGYVKRD